MDTLQVFLENFHFTCHDLICHLCMCIVCKYMRSRGRARALNLYHLPVTHCSFLFVNSILVSQNLYLTGIYQGKGLRRGKGLVGAFLYYCFLWQVYTCLCICQDTWKSPYSGIHSFINLRMPIEINLMRFLSSDKTLSFHIQIRQTIST